MPEPTTTAQRLRMQGVRKRFGGTIALDGVDIAVASGEVLALVGENGAGKSTLMKVLSGAYIADEGQMWLDGQPYRPKNPLDARRSGVAMIYQELAQAPHLSVMENIFLGIEPRRGPFMNWGEMRRQARAAMERVGCGGIPVETPIARLSVAERQLAEIARAVAVGCRVLVLDEPTSSLTSRDVPNLFRLVRQLRQNGHAIVYISHFLEEVKEISDRFVVLRDGRSVGGGVTAEASAKQIVALMVGRTVEDLYPRSRRSPGATVISLSALAGPVKPVEASLELHRGEVLGIAGLVGAGRTELVRTLFGLAPLKSGQIRVGTYMGPASPARRWRQRVGMVSEDRKTEGLALGLSIEENLTLATLPAIVRPAYLRDQSRRWLKRLDVRCKGPAQTIGQLSGGNQQKVAIARLLHHDVDMLLLDEPTRGIDVSSKAQIYQLIDELACAGKAVLIVSSYLPELLGVCDRVAVMCKGRLGPARPVAETNEHQIMLEATGSGAAA
ncbi:MAG: sugar ABC transporter ATP-binding protein [Tepidisphaeraceae bacterium]|jgi:ribose transport system ATP-binding protein